jgi:O-Antigen ligase
MLRKLQYVCLIGCIGLADADRIDLFAGRGPFTLTPFLVLAPLIVILGLFRSQPSTTFQLSVTPEMRRQLPFVAASSLFLLFTFFSIPIGLDPERGLVAFCDLLLVAGLGYYISLQVLKEPEQEKLIVRSVTLALVAYAIFVFGECIAWTHGIVMTAQRSGPWLETTFATSSIGPWIPTLSGTAYDANRSGFVLTMYLALIDRFATKSRCAPALRFAIAVLVFLTLSRSGVLCWLAYHVASKDFWSRLVSRRALAGLAGICLFGLLVFAKYQQELMAMAEAWEISDAISAKLSMDTGSSGESHVLLIERGLNTWLTSTKTVMTGIGYAAAPKVLADFFGEDKRGNFHSLYITTLAEMGLPAFIALLFLLGYPIFGRRSSICAIAAILVFNLTYQTETEPLFWLMLALLWSYGRTSARGLTLILNTGRASSLAMPKQ